MRLRVILVRPMHEINVGSVARAMKNFGQKELFLVRPRMRLGFQAKLFAKHAERIIKNARVVGSLKEATAGCGLVIGTTGVPTRYQKRFFKNVVSLKKAAEKAAGVKQKIALVFGPEDKGLAEKEFRECDVIAFIPTSPAHRVLNLSHAVAVTLYEFYNYSCKKCCFYHTASRKKTALLTQFFSSTVERMGRVRNKKRVSLAFERVLKRAVPSDDEAQALLAALGELNKALR